MSSSTSSSESGGSRADSDGAGKFLKTFVAGAAGLALTTLGLLLAADPYATGRLTPFDNRSGIAAAPRFAHAARMRDPQFDAAVFGNSTIQILNPERLDGQTGLRFVQLSIPGTGPMEQAALLRRQLEIKGGALRAVVIGLDLSWCDPSRAKRTLHPFPFWLYDGSPLAYAAGLFRMDTVDALPQRIFGRRERERPIRADGFWDYETHGYAPEAAPPPGAAVMEAKPQPGPRQSAAELLDDMLDSLPKETRAVLVFPPVFLPNAAAETPGGREARARCKVEIAGVAARRANVGIVDRWTINPAHGDPANFVDPIHYRRPLAVLIESEVARELSRNRH